MDGIKIESANKRFIVGAPGDPITISVLNSFRSRQFLIGSTQGHILKCKLTDRVISVLNQRKFTSGITCIQALATSKKHSVIVAGCESGDVIVWSNKSVGVAFTMTSKIVAVDVNEAGNVSALGQSGVFRIQYRDGTCAYAPSRRIQTTRAICLGDRTAFLGLGGRLGLRSFSSSHPLRQFTIGDAEITAMAIGPERDGIRSIFYGFENGDVFLFCWPADHFEQGRSISLFREGVTHRRGVITNITLLNKGALLLTADKTVLTIWQRDRNGFSYRVCAIKSLCSERVPIVGLAEISANTFAVGFSDGIVRTFRISGLVEGNPSEIKSEVDELVEAIQELNLRESRSQAQVQ